MTERIAIGFGAIMCFAAAIFANRGKFFWGEEGDGPLMKNQWVGRCLFGLMGAVLTYVALFVHH